MLFKLFVMPIIIFFLLVVAIGITIAGSILRFLFTGKRTSSTHENRDFNQQPRHTNQTNSHATSSPAEKKKFFDDDEGEYIDFEEVKDDKQS